VGLIESEMVVTAKWAAQNIPLIPIIAAHDIGALGYFDHHQLIDLAGLVSPEVIPFMRDETRLATISQSARSKLFDRVPGFLSKPDAKRAGCL